MFKRTILSFLCASFSILTYGQIGNQFWFAVPFATDKHADRPIYLNLSSYNEATTVTVSIPAQNIIIATVPLQSNSFKSIDLTAYLDNLYCIPFDKIQNKGLLIESTEEISAYYTLLGSNNLGIVNTDIFVLKGPNALGNDFYLPLPTAWDNKEDYDGYSAFQIVATEDGTQVTITPTQDLNQHPKNFPYIITLNKGQTYSARSESIIGILKPTGTHITSNKAIAVTIIDDTILNGINWDTGGDQIIPVKYAGKEFVAVNISGILNQDVLTITATLDNTDIFVNGTKEATISKGSSYSYSVTTTNAYVQTSNPVLIFHAGGFGNGRGVELGGALLPPLGCTGSKKVQFVRDNTETFKLSIITTANGINRFSINGNKSLLTASDFARVGTTPWYYALKTFLLTEINVKQSYSIDNPDADFHMGIMNGGTETGFRYGFFSDYGGLNLGPDKIFCKGTPVKLNAGFGKDSYTWTGGIANGQYLTTVNAGMYSVKAIKGECTFSDEIQIAHFPENIKKPILAPKDTAVCFQGTYKINANPDFVTYTWQDNSTKKDYLAQTAGKYILAVTDSNGCVKKDSVNITSLPIPDVKITYQGDLNRFCNEDNAILEVTGNAVSYKWSTLETTTSIQVNSAPVNKYFVEGFSDKGCSNKDSISFDCSDFIFIPNVFTPGSDGLNDKFVISKMFKADTWNLDVYNRWGKKMYTAHPYNNEWDGNAQENGVYYYQLEKRDNKNQHKGWVEIIK